MRWRNNDEEKKKTDSGKLLGGLERLWAHQNWAWEPKWAQNSFNITSFSITSNYVMEMDSGTNGREDETELLWLQLPASPFCLSFFFSPALPLLLLLTDVGRPQYRQRKLLHFTRSMSLPVYISSYSSAVDECELSSQMTAHVALSVDYIFSKKRERKEFHREGKGFSKVSFFKEAVTLKKRINQN